jgi:hypothetical protein
MSLLSIKIANGGTIRSSSGGFVPIAGVNGETVNGKDRPSLHKYTAFPWVDGLSNGKVVSLYKESANHAAAGPLMFGVSNGSIAYNYIPLVVSGYGAVVGSNLSLKVLSGNRILVTWQTDSVSSPMYAAKSTDEGNTWTYVGSLTYHTAADTVGNTGYYAAQYGKPVEMPSGKVLQPYYDAPVNSADHQHSGFVEFNSSLTTMTLGSFISNQSGAAFPNGIMSEVFVVVTQVGVTDATTKLVAIERNESYEAFTHFRSADGGVTWTRNDTYLMNVFAPTGVIDKYPISDIVWKGGKFYLFAGIRVSGDYYIAYSSITSTDLYNNTSAGYSALVRVADCYADVNAASNDCGYPTVVNREFPGINEVLVQWYDSDSTWDGVTGEKRERIIQKAIVF